MLPKSARLPTALTVAMYWAATAVPCPLGAASAPKAAGAAHAAAHAQAPAHSGTHAPVPVEEHAHAHSGAHAGKSAPPERARGGSGDELARVSAPCPCGCGELPNARVGGQRLGPALPAAAPAAFASASTPAPPFELPSAPLGFDDLPDPVPIAA